MLATIKRDSLDREWGDVTFSSFLKEVERSRLSFQDRYNGLVPDNMFKPELDRDAGTNLDDRVGDIAASTTVVEIPATADATADVANSGSIKTKRDLLAQLLQPLGVHSSDSAEGAGTLPPGNSELGFEIAQEADDHVEEDVPAESGLVVTQLSPDHPL